MACSSPLYRFNPYINAFSRIPCGWCMSCRVDRRSYFQDRIEYALYKDFNGYGTFGCITYDDYHIPLGQFNDLWTLRKKHVQDFWKRVRSYMSYHKINSHLLNRKFKHFTVGEYSPDDFRPHYHFIAVGLDYETALDLYEKCWDKSVIIDSRPIKVGGISYVLKYIEKQLHGQQAVETYDDNGIERPFMVNSHNVGNGLYCKDNVNFETQTYRWNGRNVPLPPWVKARYGLLPLPFKKNALISQFAKENDMSYNDADYYFRSVRDKSMLARARNRNELVDEIQYSRTDINLEIPFSQLGRKGKQVFAL